MRKRCSSGSFAASIPNKRPQCEDREKNLSRLNFPRDSRCWGRGCRCQSLGYPYTVRKELTFTSFSTLYPTFKKFFFARFASKSSGCGTAKAAKLRCIWRELDARPTFFSFFYQSTAIIYTFSFIACSLSCLACCLASFCVCFLPCFPSKLLVSTVCRCFYISFETSFSFGDLSLAVRLKIFVVFQLLSTIS